MDDKPFIDFDVYFQGSKEAGYQARVESTGGQAAVAFRLPFSDLELENLLLTVGRTRRATRRIDSPDVDKIKRFGGDLFSAVFTGETLACLLNSIRDGRQPGRRGIRIRLNLTGAPDLADLPWEYLYYSSRNLFLARSVDTPIVRYLDLPDVPEPLHVVPPLRTLVVIASPQDYPLLDAGREWTYLRSALGNLETAGLVSLDRLTEANLPALQQKLRRGNFHIVHFIGHGGFDPRTQDGVLILEGEDRRGQEVTSEKLGVLLRDHRSLRLAILNACEGARASKTDPFAGVAQSLIQQGLAAVVAMQFEISDEAANLFTREFYTALADGYPVDAALAETRKAIYLSGNDMEWGTPVLYMRAPDGRIFDIEARKEARQALVASAAISPALTSIPESGTIRLTAMASDVNGNALSGRPVDWVSSNIEIAAVSSTGLVTGVKPGTATITATIEGKSAVATITVMPITTPVPAASGRAAVFCRKCGASMPGKKFCTRCGAKLQ